MSLAVADDARLAQRPPRDIDYVVAPGWVLDLPSRAAGGHWPPPPQAQLGDLLLPERFQMLVRPTGSQDPWAAPAEDAAGRSWSLGLQYQIEQDRMLLRAVRTEGDLDADAALAGLRRLRPLDWWARRALLNLGPSYGRLTSEPSIATMQYLPNGEAVFDDSGPAAAAVAEARRLPFVSRAGRRASITPELLVSVASDYRRAWRQGLPPTKTVAELYRVSHSTAARWVGLARREGHLGAADGSRPGEAEPAEVSSGR